MDAAAELGRNPVSKHHIQPEYGEMSRLTRDGTAEPVSRDQILRHARGQGNIIFPCSADHEQDWQPYPVDPYSAICDDHTYIHTYISHISYSVYIMMWGIPEFFFPLSLLSIFVPVRIPVLFCADVLVSVPLLSPYASPPLPSFSFPAPAPFRLRPSHRLCYFSSFRSSPRPRFRPNSFLSVH